MSGAPRPEGCADSVVKATDRRRPRELTGTPLDAVLAIGLVVLALLGFGTIAAVQPPLAPPELRQEP